MMSKMPNIYRPPTGGPLRWQDDVTGELPAAVTAFIDHQLRRTTITPEQIELIRDYFEYYINAPCWETGEGEDSAYHEDFTSLRKRVKTLKSTEELDVWIKECLNVGLDPL